MLTLDKRDAINTARVNIQENPEIGAPRGFTDRFREAYNVFVNESLSTSRRNRLDEKYTEQIEQAGRAGVSLGNPLDISDIPALEFGRDLTEAYRIKKQREYDQKIKDMRKTQPGVALKTTAELIEDISHEAGELRARDELGAKNQTTGGAVGATLGVMAGAITDPVILASLPFGAGTGPASLTFAQQVLRTALIEFGIGTGTELIIQPGVYQFKKEIESPYTVSDAALNVLLAGGGAGALGGAFRSASELLKAYRKAGVGKPKTRQVKQAEQVVENHVAATESTPYERNMDGDRAHKRNLETTVEAVVKGEVLAHVPAQAARVKPATISELYSMDPDELLIDAERFQFKGGGDEKGVTERLKGVEEFDERLAGVALAFEDETGRRFIVDGHQRLALAQRAKKAGQKNVRLNTFLLRAADGISEDEAKAVAAFKNIAEGTGTAIDAARIIRDMGERGLPPLPPRSALVRNARALARLDEDAFGMVINDVIPEQYAAIVGRLVEGKDMQLAILDVLRRTAPANGDQAESIVRQALLAGSERAFERAQGSLFDDSFLVESLFSERAKILSGTLTKLRKEKNLFNTLIRSEKTIEGAGNVLAKDSNLERVIDNDQIIEEIQRLANTKGTVSEALTKSARALHNREKRIGQVIDDFVRSVRSASDEFLLDGDGTRPGGRSTETSQALDTERRLIDVRTAAEDMKALSEDPNHIDDLFANAEADLEARLTDAEIVQAINDAEVHITVNGHRIGVPDQVVKAIEAQRARIEKTGETHKIMTEERLLLRQQITDELYGAGAVKQERRYDIVLGLPASGKSVAVAEPLARRHGAILIDSDEAKKRLPEYRNGKGSGEVHEESTIIISEVLERALRNGDNIVNPIIGKTLENLESRIRGLKDIGYHVYLHYVDVPAEKALERGIKRFFTRGRLVDPYYMASIGDKPLNNFQKVRGLANGYAKYTNDVPQGQEPIILEASGKEAFDGVGQTRGPSPDGGDRARTIGTEEIADFEVPIGQRVDSETGDIVSDTMPASALLARAREFENMANSVEACIKS